MSFHEQWYRNYSQWKHLNNVSLKKIMFFLLLKIINYNMISLCKLQQLKVKYAQLDKCRENIGIFFKILPNYVQLKHDPMFVVFS